AAQSGVVLIIPVPSKNAILIVEFARELRAHGRSVLDAAVEASRQRFRPILMTSFAFILGIWPLVNATGAGAASRRSLGTPVFGGMIAASVLAGFFVPVFYVWMQGMGELRLRRKPDSSHPKTHGVAVEGGHLGAIPAGAAELASLVTRPGPTHAGVGSNGEEHGARSGRE